LSPDLELFARILKLFKSTAMLKLTSPTNSQSFIPFAESRCNCGRVFPPDLDHIVQKVFQISMKLSALIELSILSILIKKFFEKVLFS
jgi:hypothetical protein